MFAANTSRADIRAHNVKRERFLFVLKFMLCVLLTYSFTGLANFYEDYPKAREIAYGVNLFLTASIIISIGRILFISWYMRRIKRSHTVRGSFVLGTNQIAGIMNVTFIVLGLMIALGINPKEFLTSITIVAMAIALLFKDYITNMISGLLIMFSDQFTIGDIIKIGADKGKITDITLVNIVVKNEDDDIVLIPNNTAFTANITNQSIQNSRKLSVEFQLPLAHSHNQDGLVARLKDALGAFSEDIIDDTLQLKVVGVDKESVQYKVQVITNSRGNAKKRKIRNTLLLTVLEHDAEEATKVRSF